jgi:hypothetical protein
LSLIVLRGAILATAVGVLAFGLWTAWIAFRSPIGHRYWWAFVSLLGAPVASFNWSSGLSDTTIMLFQLPPVWFSTGSADDQAWIAVAFPLGAVLFRQRRRRLVGERFPMRAEDKLPK